MFFMSSQKRKAADVAQSAAGAGGAGARAGAVASEPTAAAPARAAGSTRPKHLRDVAVDDAIAGALQRFRVGEAALDEDSANQQARALRDWADGSYAFAAGAKTFGAEAALLTALRHRDLDVSRHGANAFRLLAKKADTGSLLLKLISEGHLMAALRKHEDDLATARSVCEGLAELHSRVRMSAGVCEALVAALQLHASDEDVALICLGALAEGPHLESWPDAPLPAGMAVVAALREHSADKAAATAGVMLLERCFSLCDDDGLRLLLDAGAATPLVDAVLKHRGQADIAAPVLTAMKHIIKKRHAASNQLLLAGAAYVLADVLSRWGADDKPYDLAIAVADSLVQHADADCRTKLAEPAFIKIVVEELSDIVVEELSDIVRADNDLQLESTEVQLIHRFNTLLKVALALLALPQSAAAAAAHHPVFADIERARKLAAVCARGIRSDNSEGAVSTVTCCSILEKLSQQPRLRNCLLSCATVPALLKVVRQFYFDILYTVDGHIPAVEIACTALRALSTRSKSDPGSRAVTLRMTVAKSDLNDIAEQVKAADGIFDAGSATSMAATYVVLLAAAEIEDGRDDDDDADGLPGPPRCAHVVNHLLKAMEICKEADRLRAAEALSTMANTPKLVNDIWPAKVCMAAVAALVGSAGERNLAAENVAFATAAVEILNGLAAAPHNRHALLAGGAVQALKVAAGWHSDNAVLCANVCTALAALGRSLTATRYVLTAETAAVWSAAIKPSLARHATDTGVVSSALGAAASWLLSADASGAVAVDEMHAAAEAVLRRPSCSVEVISAGSLLLSLLQHAKAPVTVSKSSAAATAAAASEQALSALPRCDRNQIVNAAALWAAARGDSARLVAAAAMPVSAGAVNWNFALDVAASAGHEDAVEAILAASSSRYRSQELANSALAIAASIDHGSLASRLLHRWGACPLSMGCASFWCAADNRSAGMLELLLQSPAVTRAFAVRGTAAVVDLNESAGQLARLNELLEGPGRQPDWHGKGADATNDIATVIQRLLLDARPEADAACLPVLRAAAVQGCRSVVAALLEDPRVDPMPLAEESFAVAQDLPAWYAAQRFAIPVCAALRLQPSVLRRFVLPQPEAADAFASAAPAAPLFRCSASAADAAALAAAAWRRRRAAVLAWQKARE